MTATQNSGPNDRNQPASHEKPRDKTATVWPDVDNPERPSATGVPRTRKNGSTADTEQVPDTKDEAEPRSDESSDKGPL
jgi:hypothetical protein